LVQTRVVVVCNSQELQALQIMIIVFKWWLDNLQYSFHHGINHVILLGVADLTESKICFEMIALVVYYRRTLFGEYLLTWWNLFYHIIKSIFHVWVYRRTIWLTLSE